MPTINIPKKLKTGKITKFLQTQNPNTPIIDTLEKYITKEEISENENRKQDFKILREKLKNTWGTENKNTSFTAEEIDKYCY